MENAEFRIIRFNELQEKLGGISRSTIDKWEKFNNFPRRVNLGPNTIGWRLNEVNNWIKMHK